MAAFLGLIRDDGMVGRMDVEDEGDDGEGGVGEGVVGVVGELDEVVLLEVQLQDGVLHRREHEADVLGVWKRRVATKRTLVKGR